MSIHFIKNIKEAISNLNPHEIREEAERPVRIGLFAENDASYHQMEAYFAPAQLSEGRRAQIAGIVSRASFAAGDTPPPLYDIEIYSAALRPPPTHGYSFTPQEPERTVRAILRDRPEMGLTLARHVYPFRQPFAQHAIRKISKENGLFSLATALPDVIPFVSLPWAVGEFASDAAFLTANQIRLAFLIAAGSDREVGYGEQKAEIASIVLGAFGWRALARELVGKIPYGGGLIPKAAVAYAGTWVAGASLERYYRIGYGYTRVERKAAYEDAFSRGRQLAGAVLDQVRSRKQLATKY